MIDMLMVIAWSFGVDVVKKERQQDQVMIEILAQSLVKKFLVYFGVVMTWLPHTFQIILHNQFSYEICGHILYLHRVRSKKQVAA